MRQAVSRSCFKRLVMQGKTRRNIRLSCKDAKAMFGNDYMVYTANNIYAELSADRKAVRCSLLPPVAIMDVVTSNKVAKAIERTLERYPLQCAIQDNLEHQEFDDYFVSMQNSRALGRPGGHEETFISILLWADGTFAKKHTLVQATVSVYQISTTLYDNVCKIFCKIFVTM